jgi:hypothetical protein
MANDLTLKVGFDIDKFQKELSKTTGMLNKWGTTVQSSLMGVAAGFSALAVGQFAFDVSKLAGEAEGVKAAFDKLPKSVQVMQDLKEATSGTVSELELMKRAVTATNFGIEIEALPKLLEFAAIRAKQTGQSVDYLVDSIVTGIGRKSPLILDNLGISTTRLKEKFGGAALEAQSIADVARAVGAIAEEELGKMGSMSENASTKIERLGASWDNLKVAIGNTANSTGILGTAIDKINEALDVAASDKIPMYMKALNLMTFGIANDILKKYDAILAQKELNEEQQKHAKVLAEVDRAMASGNAKAYLEATKQHIYYNEILAEYTRRVSEEEKNKASSLNTTTDALTKNTKAIIDNSDAEREARIAKLDRQLAGSKPTGLGGMGGVALPNIQTGAIESMKSALASLAEQNNTVTESFNAQAISIYENAAALGEMLGSAVGASNGVAQAFAAMASQVVKSIGNMIMAKMINAALDDKASNSFFPAKIALVGAAIATAQVLLRKIGASGGGGGGVSGGGGGGGGGARGGEGMRLESLGQRIEVVGTFKVEGKDLKAAITNQNRADNRTKAG